MKGFPVHLVYKLDIFPGVNLRLPLLPLSNPLQSLIFYFISLESPHFFPIFPLFSHHCGEGNGNPLQYSCLENPVDRAAWWAAVHRVAQSDTTEVT